MSKIIVSDTAGAVPMPGDLGDNDLGVNHEDGKLYTKLGEFIPSTAWLIAYLEIVADAIDSGDTTALRSTILVLQVTNMD